MPSPAAYMRDYRAKEKLPPGARAALAAMERSLARASEPGLVKRLSDACVSLRRLYELPDAPYRETGDLRRQKVSNDRP